MMDFVLNTMNIALKMMDFVLKMMNLSVFEANFGIIEVTKNTQLCKN